MMNEEMKPEASAEAPVAAASNVHDVPVEVLKAEEPAKCDEKKECDVKCEEAPLQAKDPNAGLKSLLELTFDSAELVQLIVAKKSFIHMIPKAYEVVSDVPKVVEAWPTLKEEIVKLPGSGNEADLLAFVQNKVAGIGAPEKAQKILAASLKLVHNLSLDVNDLIVAIKS